jgi:hypothetical protein
VVDRLPGAVPLGQVAPGGAGAQPPEDAVEGGAVVGPLAAAALPGGEILDEVPLRARQLVPPPRLLRPQPAAGRQDSLRRIRQTGPRT